jgi:hypothetical protein
MLKNDGGEFEAITSDTPKGHNMDKEISKKVHEWKVVYIFASLPPWILKTPMKTWSTSHVIPFQEMLEYQDAISICYGRQATIHLFS